MRKRFAGRGDTLYCASSVNPLVIELYHVLSDRGERFQWMGPCSRGSHQETHIPDFLHETPEKAFEAAKKRRISNAEGAIEKALRDLRAFRGMRNRAKKLRVKDISRPKPKSFEQRLREWECDY